MFLLPAVMMGQTTAPQAPPAKSTTAAPNENQSQIRSKVRCCGEAHRAGALTDEQKTVYALGLQMYRSLSQFDLSPAEVELVKRAFVDAAAGKPAEDLNEWGPKFQAFGQTRSARVAEKQKVVSRRVSREGGRGAWRD